MAPSIQCPSCSNLLVPGLAGGVLVCPACKTAIPPVPTAPGSAPAATGLRTRRGLHPGIYGFAAAAILLAAGILVWRPGPFATPKRAGPTPFVEPHSMEGANFGSSTLEANLNQVAREMRDARADPGDFDLQVSLVRQFQLLALEWGMTHGRPPYTDLAPYVKEADGALRLAAQAPHVAMDQQTLNGIQAYESVLKDKIEANSAAPSEASRQESAPDASVNPPGTMVASRQVRTREIARRRAEASAAAAKGLLELDGLERSDPDDVYAWRRHAELLLAVLGGQVKLEASMPREALFRQAAADLNRAAKLSRSKQGKLLTAKDQALLDSFNHRGDLGTSRA